MNWKYSFTLHNTVDSIGSPFAVWYSKYPVKLSNIMSDRLYDSDIMHSIENYEYFTVTQEFSDHIMREKTYKYDTALDIIRSIDRRDNADDIITRGYIILDGTDGAIDYLDTQRSRSVPTTDEILNNLSESDLSLLEGYSYNALCAHVKFIVRRYKRYVHEIHGKVFTPAEILEKVCEQ